MKKLFSILFVCISLINFGQLSMDFNKRYKEGDMIKETALMYDSSNTKKQIVIPAGEYILWYNLNAENWNNKTGSSFIMDSVRKIESVLPEILKKYGIQKLRIICCTYKAGSEYFSWLQTIKKEKIFNPSPSYSVEYYAFKDDAAAALSLGLRDKLTLISTNGKILCGTMVISVLQGKQKTIQRVISAKLLNEKNGNKTPLLGPKVYLMENSATAKAVSETTTDKYGDFQLNLPNDDKKYTISVVPIEGSANSVILATREGEEISRMVKVSNRFEYKLLSADIVKLSGMDVDEDITLKLKDFTAGKKSEIKVEENITYSLASFQLEKKSFPVLDKVVAILKENPKAKVEIISHTDSQGDDDKNLTLSQKRSGSVMDYLISKGVDTNRIKAIGVGEKKIRNRCNNGIDCSDKEHEFNRRTEFLFTKG